MKAADQALGRIEYATDTLAILAMFACMALVAVDVFFRYGLNSPLAWSMDVVILYLLPGIFFMGLPGSYAKGAHVAVDIILNIIGPHSRLLLSVVARIFAIAVFALIAFYGVVRVVEAVTLREIQPGTIVNWPIWPSVLMVACGATLAMVRAIERFLIEVHALSLGERAVREQLTHTAHEEGLAQ